MTQVAGGKKGVGRGRKVARRKENKVHKYKIGRNRNGDNKADMGLTQEIFTLAERGRRDEQNLQN